MKRTSRILIVMLIASFLGFFLGVFLWSIGVDSTPRLLAGFGLGLIVRLLMKDWINEKATQ